MAQHALLSRTRFLLADLDGVFYRGSEAIPGAAEFVRWTAERGIALLYITNNSTRTPAQFVDKLERMDIPGRPEQVLTSSLATRAYLEERAPRGTRVHAIGQRGILEALFGDGYFAQVDDDPAYVVVGLDTQFSYDKLRRACLLIRAGATFIGTNPDRTFPAPEGITPGCGSLLAAVEAATDVRPIIIGKPEPWLMREGLRRLGADPAATAVLGDRLDTDIIGGQRLGLATIMVLTGVHGEAEVARSEIRPDVVYRDLVELKEEWEEGGE